MTAEACSLMPSSAMDTTGSFDITIDDDAPVGMYDLTLTASANGVSASAPAQLEVTALAYIVRLGNPFTTKFKMVKPGESAVFDISVSRDSPEYPGNLTVVISGNPPQGLMVLPDPITPADVKFQPFVRMAPAGDADYEFNVTVKATNGDNITVLPAGGINLELKVMAQDQPMVNLTAQSKTARCSSLICGAPSTVPRPHIRSLASSI